jgi:predicted kinase
MKQPFLLIIDGMTGSGKTIVSKLLSEQISRVAVIGMDKVKRFISDFKRCKKDNAIARDIVFEMTKKYFDHNISVIIDQPFKTEQELKKYENIAQKYSIPIYKVQLFTTPKLAFERVINRQKDRENKVPENRIKRNISLFKNKKDKGFVVIDTSKISSNEVVEKILKIINS